MKSIMFLLLLVACIALIATSDKNPPEDGQW
jgi:hypothetical protein